MHAPTRRLSGLLVLTVALIVSACSSGGQASGGGSPGQLAGGDTGNGSISLAAPADGATVSIPFDVAIDSSVPLGAPETGNHHAHLYFDTDTNAADYDIVYGNTWKVTRQLAPGPHKITVALANPDHSLAGPTQTITVQVGSGGSSGGASSAPSSAPSGSQPPPPGY